MDLGRAPRHPGVSALSFRVLRLQTSLESNADVASMLAAWSLELAVEVTVAAALVLTLGVVVYALGSFLLMRRHATARAFGAFVRELLRETFLATITQP